MAQPATILVMVNNLDCQHMARALVLARRGLFTTDPNPRVGCVVVKGGRVVGEGWHVRAGERHAEINALRFAGEASRGATAYVTLEPCCHYGRTPPCTQALVTAGVAKVHAAMRDPNPRVAGQGLAELQAAGVAVDCGLMEQQARDLNPGYIRRMTGGRPFVRCKLAMSMDGRTAMASGESRWITGEAARADVHSLRARSSAIMTGIGTVVADDPLLSVRISGEAAPRQPLRVILDSDLRAPHTARIFHGEGRVLVFTTVADESRHGPLLSVGAEVQVAPGHALGLDLQAVMVMLAARDVNEVHLECGATLAGAMLQAGLIDELIVYVAPVLMGDAARGLFHLPELSRMSERITVDIIDVRAIGLDWRVTARPGPVASCVDM